ncbi:hypothetical protein [Halosolutus gelatinilyticus]|nr:hypothetical protein [Halosolutus gelatinilyticus]
MKRIAFYLRIEDGQRAAYRDEHEKGTLSVTGTIAKPPSSGGKTDFR